MSRKIIYVFNPISGRRQKSTLLKKIEAATRAQNLHFEFFPSHPLGDYNLLRKKIKSEKITDVIIIGGDGTVNQVTGSLKNCNVKFGIVPAGSGNGLAYAAKIPKNINKALQIIFDGNAKKADAFMVGSYYACMLSGFGFDATVAYKFATLSKR